jgi:hypothetical protein
VTEDQEINAGVDALVESGLLSQKSARQIRSALKVTDAVGAKFRWNAAGALLLSMAPLWIASTHFIPDDKIGPNALDIAAIAWFALTVIAGCVCLSKASEVKAKP